MIDYTRLRKKLIPEPDGEPHIVMRTGTISQVNANGTVDLQMSDGTIVPGVSRLVGAYTPVGAVVQVLSFRGSLIVIGGTATIDTVAPLIKTGSLTAGPTAATTISVPVSFGVTFPAIPSVHVNLSGSGASPSAQWVYHALNVTATGFTLFGFGTSGTFSQTFRWSAILAP